MEEEVEVRSLDELRDWLSGHHATSTGVWLVTWKKGRGPYLAYGDVVDELLSWGWIDSRPRKVDADRTALMVTPRRPGSGWSGVNKEKVARLTADGRMQPPGIAAVERAREDGTWVALDHATSLSEPAELTSALDAVPAAREHWDTFPPSTRRGILEWIGSAKTEATRQRRVQQTVDEAAVGRRANQWRQPGAGQPTTVTE